MKPLSLAYVLAMMLPALPAGAQKSPAGDEMKPIAPRLAISAPRNLPVDGRAAYQRHPAVSWGRAGYLIAWQDGYSGAGGDSNILAMRLDASGRPIGRRPIAICTHKQVVESPAVAWCAGRWLIAWSDMRNGRDFDLYARWVDVDGRPGEEFLVAGGKGGQANPAVAADGKDLFLIVWQDYRSGDYFAVYAARVSARTGRGAPSRDSAIASPGLLDAGGVRVMPRGEEPAIAFTGKDFLITQKWYGVRVGRDGRPRTEVNQLWKTKLVLHPATALAWGEPYVFFNTEPRPDPWGWGGNGAIVGVTVDEQGASPEKRAYFEKNTLRRMSALEADGRLLNCIDAARWRNRPGWPMGAPGGLKASHEGTWPHGRVAAAFNQRTLLVVWPRAHFHDKSQLSNHDLYLRRLGPGWAAIDHPKICIAAGPTDEIDPVLAAGPAGEALLAYEILGEVGGIRINLHHLREGEDVTAPQVRYVVPLDERQTAVGFDEPIDPASVALEGIAIKGVKVTAAKFNDDPRFRQREVVLTTDAPLTPGKNYALRIAGVTDRSPKRNATTGQLVAFVAQPGRPARSGFIDRFAVLGPLPNLWKVKFIDPADSRPAPGQRVELPESGQLARQFRDKIGPRAWKERGLDAKFNKLFAGPRKWEALQARDGVVVQPSGRFGELPDACCYLHTWVYAGADQSALLRVDSSDGHRAWLNGKLLYADPTENEFRGFNNSTNETDVKLRRGWNRLLLQVENRFGRWRVAAQLTDGGGIPIRGLTYSLAGPDAE